ncbi:hypothetical protein CSC44_3062 [Pseudomonas aeruginosa]|nr:hypothetical protein CSC44_3062 [Pseudomonas aeruginosa]
MRRAVSRRRAGGVARTECGCRRVRNGAWQSPLLFLYG